MVKFSHTFSRLTFADQLREFHFRVTRQNADQFTRYVPRSANDCNCFHTASSFCAYHICC